MKFNLFKKKEIPTTVSVTIPACSANQDKPECSLIEELREIQKELNQENDFEIKREKIMERLSPREEYNFSIYSPYYREPKMGLLDEIVCRKCRYINVYALTNAIDLLQQYKELTEKQIEYEQHIKVLKQRELEIKIKLGIK